ncbi:hypothetical protein GCM10009743_69120 [Kribbella swartbergensis]
MPAEFRVGMQVAAYLDRLVANVLHPGEDVGDQQLVSHPAILASRFVTRRSRTDPVSASSPPASAVWLSVTAETTIE